MALGIVLLIAFVIGYVLYANWLRRGIQPRSGDTALPIPTLRSLFASSVAGTGWKVIDEDNPMVAQSPLMAGRRQQISLRYQSVGGRTRFVIGPNRVWVKGGVPYKAHTIRMRLNSFVHAVRSADASTAIGGSTGA
jgi:hypothetical protein